MFAQLKLLTELADTFKTNLRQKIILIFIKRKIIIKIKKNINEIKSSHQKSLKQQEVLLFFKKTSNNC